MKTVYLCGAINGCTDAEAKDWREKAKAQLACVYRLLDPMRRDYRGKEDESVGEIVSGDYADIAVSDLVLAAAERPSWGTAMEIHHAFGIGKQVLIIANGRISPWLRYHSHWIVPTLDLAIGLLMNVAIAAEIETP